MLTRSRKSRNSLFSILDIQYQYNYNQIQSPLLLPVSSQALVGCSTAHHSSQTFRSIASHCKSLVQRKSNTFGRIPQAISGLTEQPPNKKESTLISPPCVGQLHPSFCRTLLHPARVSVLSGGGRKTNFDDILFTAESGLKPTKLIKVSSQLPAQDKEYRVACLRQTQWGECGSADRPRKTGTWRTNRGMKEKNNTVLG